MDKPYMSDFSPKASPYNAKAAVRRVTPQLIERLQSIANDGEGIAQVKALEMLLRIAEVNQQAPTDEISEVLWVDINDLVIERVKERLAAQEAMPKAKCG